MKTTTEKPAAPSDLPEEMRDPTVAYLIEQAEKFRLLQAAEGKEDAQAGPGQGMQFREFLRNASPKCVEMLQARQARRK